MEKVFENIYGRRSVRKYTENRFQKPFWNKLPKRAYTPQAGVTRKALSF